MKNEIKTVKINEALCSEMLFFNVNSERFPFALSIHHQVKKKEALDLPFTPCNYAHPFPTPHVQNVSFIIFLKPEEAKRKLE